MRWIAVIALGLAACSRPRSAVPRDEPNAAPRLAELGTGVPNEGPRARVDLLEKLPETDTPLPSRNPLLCLGHAAGGQLAVETEWRSVFGVHVWHLFADASGRGATVDVEKDRVIPPDFREQANLSTAKIAAAHGRIDREQLDDLVERLGSAIVDVPKLRSTLMDRGVARVQWRCDASAPWNELRIGYQNFGGDSPELALDAAVERLARTLPLRSNASTEDDEPFDVRRLRK